MDFPSHQHFEKQIRKELPRSYHHVMFRVDMAPLDPRPDPKDQRGVPLYVYDPGTRTVSTEPLEEFLDLLPTRLVQFRIYSLDFKSRGADTVLLTQDSLNNFDPTWSPDAQWLAYTKNEDGNTEIYVMTATGLLPTNLTGSPSQDLQPAWQP